MLCDRAQYRCRFEERNHDMGATEHDLPYPCSQIGEVEHRCGVEQYRRVVEQLSGGHRPQAGGHQIRVGEHDALGESGGTAGVEEAGQGVAAASYIGNGIVGCHQILVRHHAVRGGAVPAVDDGGQVGTRRA